MTYEKLEKSGDLLRVYYNQNTLAQHLQPAPLPHVEWKYEVWKHEERFYLVEFFGENGLVILPAKIYDMLTFAKYDTVDTIKDVIIKTAHKHNLPSAYTQKIWNLSSNRHNRQACKHVSREQLYDLYVTQKMSAVQVAEKLFISHPIVRKKLREYGITVRKQGRRKI